MGITPRIEMSPAQSTELAQLLDRYLPNVQVWAFGSRVKGTARTNSDLDLVIFSRPEQEQALYSLREALEESNLPFRVDLLVWDNLPDNFKTNIEQQYVVIRGSERDVPEHRDHDRVPPAGKH